MKDECLKVRSDSPREKGRKGRWGKGKGNGEKKRKEERYEEGKKEKRKRWESWGYLYPETSRPDWDGSLRKVF
jgi:hypothetical protein